MSSGTVMSYNYDFECLNTLIRFKCTECQFSWDNQSQMVKTYLIVSMTTEQNRIQPNFQFNLPTLILSASVFRSVSVAVVGLNPRKLNFETSTEKSKQICLLYRPALMNDSVELWILLLIAVFVFLHFILTNIHPKRSTCPRKWKKVTSVQQASNKYLYIVIIWILVQIKTENLMIYFSIYRWVYVDEMIILTWIRKSILKPR